MEKTVWVLWWKYDDGSGQGIARAYGDEKRAKDDLALVGADLDKTWKLTEVSFFGGNNERSTESL